MDRQHREQMDGERTTEVSISDVGTQGMEGGLPPAMPAAVPAASPAAPEPARPSPTAAVERPEVIGGYQILAPIAQGGMAQVYLARPAGATAAHRHVAVKRLRPELVGDDRFASMFLDELQIASRVCHPNVCSVLDFGVEGGEAFLVMEYLQGETLASIRRKLVLMGRSDRFALDLKERMAFVCRTIAEAAEGLHAAHEQRDLDGRPLEIVHRDVSPENLLVTFDGCVKVLDFGVARASCQTHTTRAGDVKGKFAYMAPEILDGQQATRRTDVWGLGVILWELLTLKRLFRQETDAQTLQAVMHMNIEPPSVHQPGIPAALDAIVMAALQRDPADRTPSARHLAQALTAFLVRRRTLAGAAQTSAHMLRLFPGGRDEKRRQLQAALSGKPILVETHKDAAPSHADQVLTPPAQRRPLRTCATRAIRAFRRRPWRLVVVSAVTGAGLWWFVTDGSAGPGRVIAAAATAQQALGSDTSQDDLDNEERHMARLLKAAGARLTVLQTAEDSVTVTIKIPQQGQIYSAAAPSP